MIEYGLLDSGCGVGASRDLVMNKLLTFSPWGDPKARVYIGQDIHGNVVIVDNFREFLLSLQEAGNVIFLDAKTSLLRVS